MKITIEVDLEPEQTDQLVAELIDYMIHVEQIVPIDYGVER